MVADDRPKPLWASLTMQSTREEVLAAVAESDALDARVQKSMAAYTDDRFPGMPADPARRRGCYWSDDGQVRVSYRGDTSADRAREAEVAEEELVNSIHAARQAAAGEESQDPGDWTP